MVYCVQSVYLSCPRVRELSLNVPADAGLLCGKAVVIDDNKNILYEAIIETPVSTSLVQSLTSPRLSDRTFMSRRKVHVERDLKVSVRFLDL